MGVMVKTALAFPPAAEAMTLTVVVMAEPTVLTPKFAVVAPAATVTVAGTEALTSLVDRLITVPLAPAG